MKEVNVRVAVELDGVAGWNVREYVEQMVREKCPWIRKELI